MGGIAHLTNELHWGEATAMKNATTARKWKTRCDSRPLRDAGEDIEATREEMALGFWRFSDKVSLKEFRFASRIDITEK